MKFIVGKIDMDCVLTAYILGCTKSDTILRIDDIAGAEELKNPNIICIECGGSGQVHLNNWDHHDTNEYLESACKQALQSRKNSCSSNFSGSSCNTCGWHGCNGRQVCYSARLAEVVTIVDCLDRFGKKKRKPK